MDAGTPVENISIVLVQTKTPANIGAVARCMMNMGLSRLVLIDPPNDPNGDALKLAAGADGILENASIFSSLDDAVADQSLVVGATRHPRRRRSNVHSPREIAEQILPLANRNKISIVFGNEINGLDQHHLALCSELVSIPSSSGFPSLNLSHAVMVVAYELFLTSLSGLSGTARELASGEQLRVFFEHLQTTLERIRFIDSRNVQTMMHSLRQIFSRSRLDSREVSILLGILTEINRSCKADG